MWSFRSGRNGSSLLRWPLERGRRGRRSLDSCPLGSSPLRTWAAAVALVGSWTLGGAACGGAKAPPPESPPAEPAVEVTDEEVEEYLESTRVKLDEEAANIALARGARKVKNCRETADVPPGEGDVEVVFDGTKGRVTDVILGPEWMTLPDAAQVCIRKSYVGEIVPPFEGDAKRTTTVVIPEKGAGAKEGDEGT
ncbi:MAG: hypothetical protein AAF715_18145 [Myxococcota bacterium]